ncbi:MAG: hypothetical protein SFV24_19245 [Gemmatimonadales bacterium]|nr:hypothetical protein [Gemmatimonadales bacterium]
MAKLPRREVQRRQRTKSGILTELEVARIKRLLAEGESPRQLADAYEVSLWAIRAIGRGDTWAWVEPEGVHVAPAETSPELPGITPSTDDADESLQRFLAENPDLAGNGATDDSSALERMLEEANARKRQEDELAALKTPPKETP